MVEELERAAAKDPTAPKADGSGTARGQLTNRGGGTARMTPRVPNSGDVAPKMTPRMPLGGGRAGSGTARGGAAEPVVLKPEQVATLDRDKIKFLTKKLVHLTVLLEQDTVADDAKYPSFYSV